MPDLSFRVEAVEAAEAAIRLQLAIENAARDEFVHSIALTVQLQVEPARRRYSEQEKEALMDLFGERDRWPTTVRPIFWTTVTTKVPQFTGRTQFELRVPCAFASDVAADKYMRAVEDGEVPVALLFSGRVMYAAAGGLLQMAPIPWSQETSCRIPVCLCKEIAAARGTP